MSPAVYKRHLLYLADGDLHKALDICIHQLAVAGHCISAGYVRDPQNGAAYLEPPPEQLDIDQTDAVGG